MARSSRPGTGSPSRPWPRPGSPWASLLSRPRADAAELLAAVRADSGGWRGPGGTAPPGPAPGSWRPGNVAEGLFALSGVTGEARSAVAAGECWRPRWTGCRGQRGFYDAADDGQRLIYRPADPADGPSPSARSRWRARCSATRRWRARPGAGGGRRGAGHSPGAGSAVSPGGRLGPGRRRGQPGRPGRGRRRRPRGRPAHLRAAPDGPARRTAGTVLALGDAQAGGVPGWRGRRPAAGRPRPGRGCPAACVCRGFACRPRSPARRSCAPSCARHCPAERLRMGRAPFAEGPRLFRCARQPGYSGECHARWRARGAHRDKRHQTRTGRVVAGPRGVLVREVARRRGPVLRAATAAALGLAAVGAAGLTASPAFAVAPAGAARAVAPVVTQASGFSVTSIPGPRRSRFPPCPPPFPPCPPRLRWRRRCSRWASSGPPTCWSSRPRRSGRPSRPRSPGCPASPPRRAWTRRRSASTAGPSRCSVSTRQLPGLRRRADRRSNALWTSVAAATSPCPTPWESSTSSRWATGSPSPGAPSRSCVAARSARSASRARTPSSRTPWPARWASRPGNAVVVSAPGTSLTLLAARIKAILPRGAGVASSSRRPSRA